MAYKTDIEIAREANKKPIMEIGAELGIGPEDLVPYGHDKAKVSQSFISSLADKPKGKLVLVTAINPTPAGEGKTTTTVGLGDGLNRIGSVMSLHGQEDGAQAGSHEVRMRAVGPHRELVDGPRNAQTVHAHGLGVTVIGIDEDDLAPGAHQPGADRATHGSGPPDDDRIEFQRFLTVHLCPGPRTY